MNLGFDLYLGTPDMHECSGRSWGRRSEVGHIRALQANLKRRLLRLG